MSERAFRLASFAFAMLAVAVLVNLMVLQPARQGGQGFATNRAASAGMMETSALRPAETSDALRNAAATGAVMKITAPAEPSSNMPGPFADKAETTRAIQRELTARGYETGGIDGVAGLMTEAAIMAYEADNGQALTARPSDDLLRALLLGPGSGPVAARVAQPQSARASDVIRTVQQQLHKLGYTPGRADGQLGESTIKAIRAFEKQQDLADSGRISSLLVARLTTLAGPGRVADGR